MNLILLKYINILRGKVINLKVQSAFRKTFNNKLYRFTQDVRDNNFLIRGKISIQNTKSIKSPV